MSERQTTKLHVFRYPGQVLRIKFRRRDAFVLLQRGFTPEVTDSPGPGEYEIDAFNLDESMNFPLVAVVVPKAHSAAFRAMTVPQVDALIDSTCSALRSQAN